MIDDGEDRVDEDAPAAEPGDHERHDPADGARGRQREEPADHDAPRRAPAHRSIRGGRAPSRSPSRRRPASSTARSRGRSRRGSWRRSTTLGREALRGLHVGEPLAERADDAPAAHVGAEGDRDAAREDHPGLRLGVCALLCQPAMIRVSVMTPIVFCASFVPCASATSDDVKIWPTRNPSRPSGLRVVATGDHVGELRGGERDDPRRERREDRGEDDLATSRRRSRSPSSRRRRSSRRSVRRTARATSSRAGPAAT